MKLYYIFFYFSVNLCFHYFCDFQKKDPRPKWTIYKHESGKNKKCLSVGNFGILSVFAYHLSVTLLQPKLAYVEA